MVQFPIFLLLNQDWPNAQKTCQLSILPFEVIGNQFEIVVRRLGAYNHNILTLTVNQE